MKRSAPPGSGGGSSKRPATEPSKDGQGLTTNDALSYLREVKSRFANQREVYDQFLDVMKEFKAQSIDTNGVITKVQRLFTGHPELVMGFNLFLPHGYKIERAQVPGAGPLGKSVPSKPRSRMPAKAAARRPSEGAAKKKAAQAAEAAPKAKPTVQPAKESPVKPDAEPAAPKQPVEFDQAINYVNKIKRRFAGDEKVYKAFLEILNQYRKGQRSIGQVYEEVSLLFRDQADLLEEFTYFLPDTNQKQPARPPPTAPRTCSRPARPTSARPPTAPASRAAPQGSEDEGQHGRLGRVTARSRGRTTSEEGTNTRGATLYGAAGKGAQSSSKGGDLLKELSLFARMKQTLRSKDMYADLLKVIAMFSKDIISKGELEAFASGLLANYPEMLQGLLTFMENVPQIELNYEKGRDAEWDQQTLTQKQIDTLKTVSRWETYMTLPISELDLSSTRSCSTSYRRLPSDYPKLHASGRTSMQASVLNDCWVSVITGSEDYSFKHMRKNQYEDTMFRCEDDRFELDMVIHSNLSTLKQVNRLLEKYELMEPEERVKVPVALKDFSAIHQRSIKRLYGDSSPQVFDMLERNPYICLQTVRARLEQKAAEFAKVKAEMEPQWQRQYTANYINSLDHRSFYFKQSDKRTISAKGLLAEVHELAEKRSSTPEHLATLSAGTASAFAKLHLPPDIEMEYDEPCIHEDCYRLILCTMRVALGPTAQARVLEIWRSVMEPLLCCVWNVKEEEEEQTEGVTMANGVSQVKQEGSAGSQEGSLKTADAHEDAKAMMRGAHAAEPSGMDVDGAAEASSGASKDDEEDDEEGEEGAGEGDEAEGEEEETHKNHTFRHCKPVMSAATGYVEAEEAKAGNCRTLYCHDSLFVALRLHHLLYSRLKTARKCCYEQKKRRFNPHGHKEQEKTDAQIQRERAKGEKDHEEFLYAVEQLVRNKMDGTAFEDQMRPLLGARAYVTFTLDKLLQRFVKQMQNMAQDPLVPRLLALQRYEGAKLGGGFAPAGSLMEATYHTDAQVLLQEEACFRVEVESGQPTRIRCTLMDPTLARSDSYLNMINNDFKEHLQLWMSRTASKAGRSFLERGLRRSVGKHVSEVGEPTLEGCRVLNGLEIKVACATSKVSYVLGTEDVFVRRRRGSYTGKRAAQREMIKKRRSRQFHAWLEKATAQAKTYEAQAAAGLAKAMGMEMFSSSEDSSGFDDEEDMDEDKEN